MVNDPIADFLIRIQNAEKVSHPEVKIPFSRMKLELAKILEREKLIDGFEQTGEGVNSVLLIKLKYNDGEPAIHKAKRISKPGQRIYKNKDKIVPVRNGYGLAIISTSKGLMTDKEARKQGLGGELICKIW